MALNYEASPSVAMHAGSGTTAHLVVDTAVAEQPFNRLPYNRPFSNFLDLGFTAHGVSDMSVRTVMDFVSAIRADGEGTMTATLMADVLMTLLRLDGIGTLAVNVTPERLFAAAWHGKGTMTAHASRYHVDEIVITGSFKPGDRLVIDSRNLTVRLNGQNALRMLQGDFFDLNTGTNVITYSDDQISRNIRIRVTHRDKYV